MLSPETLAYYAYHLRNALPVSLAVAAICAAAVVVGWW